MAAALLPMLRADSRTSLGSPVLPEVDSRTRKSGWGAAWLPGVPRIKACAPSGVARICNSGCQAATSGLPA